MVVAPEHEAAHRLLFYGVQPRHHLRKQLLARFIEQGRFFRPLHHKPGTSARPHCRDCHAPSLATHHIALSIEALDHEQLRIDRVNKSLREIPDLFRSGAATIPEDVVRKEFCALFVGPLGMRIDVLPFLLPFELLHQPVETAARDSNRRKIR